MRVIGVISGKGGVGKTTTSINLGGALNYFGEDVTVVDANYTTPDVSVSLGFPKLGLSLQSALKGQCKGNEALYSHPSGTKLLPASISLDELNVDINGLSRVVSELDSDIVVVDACAGFGKDFFAVMNAVDEVLVVVNPNLPSVTNALKSVSLAKKHGKRVLGVVLNKVDGSGLSAREVESLVGESVIAQIPHDNDVKKALEDKEMVVYSEPNSDASLNFKKLAADLIGRDYKLASCKESRVGKVFRVLGW